MKLQFKHWTEWLPWRLWRRVLHPSPLQTADERQVTLGEYQVFLAAVSTIPIIIGLVFSFVKLTKIQSAVTQSRLTITSPRDGESVGLGQKVLGKTPFRDLRHYIVVTRVSTGQQTIQPKPAFVDNDGTFTGKATFGDESTGKDDEYTIRVFATGSEGVVSTIPRDATLSDPIKVRRVQPETYGVVITSPTDGALVLEDERIAGRTSLPDLNHYVVITPLRTGTAFVQDEPASVNKGNGTFSGRARFGGAQVGVGERFSVRVLATKSTLRAGPIVSEEGAVSSEPVTVTRKN